jgi:DNA-binding winged helix-turn-helix (wHTH) protein
LTAVWPGVVVDDANVTVQISALRRVLDEGRCEPSLIQTVPWRGYRFTAAVRLGDGIGTDREAPSAAGSANSGASQSSASGTHVRRDKAALFPVGARPTRRIAPAGSNRGRHGGDEMSEAPG